MSDESERRRERIDPAGSAVVRRAVAAGLRQHLVPETSPMPAALERLLHELRRQEAAAGDR